MIACTADVNFGMPSIKGRRISVYNVLTTAYYATDIYDELKDFKLTPSDLNDAINYCKNLYCKTDKDRLHYCDGCILRTIDEGWEFKKEDYIELEADGQKITRSKDGTVIFIGSLQEFEDEEFGRVGWLLAEEVQQKISGW